MITLKPVKREKRARDKKRKRAILKIGRFKIRLTRDEVRELSWQCYMVLNELYEQDMKIL